MGPITAPERELRWREDMINPRTGPVDDIWSETDISWVSLVRAGVGSGYLVRIGVS